MICPMRNGSNGGVWDCKGAACAWWDKETHQCAVFILAQAVKMMEGKKISTVKIEKEWGADI